MGWVLQKTAMRPSGADPDLPLEFQKSAHSLFPMNLPQLPLLAALFVLVACGEKEAPAPAPKVQQESSVDSLLHGGSPEPKTTQAATTVPNSVQNPPSPPAPVASTLRPDDPNYAKFEGWIRRWFDGTPEQKQTVRTEINKAGLTPKEHEEFEKMKKHFGVQF